MPDTPPPDITPLLDALLSYAVDPTNWDRVVAQFEKQQETIAKLDPQEFLSYLTHAESLAWQLKDESDEHAEPHYLYALIDDRGRVLDASENFGDLAGYASVDADRRIRFDNDATQAEFSSAASRARRDDAENLLLTLRGSSARVRFGYVMGVDRLPRTMRIGYPDTRVGLFIAQATPPATLKRAVQSTFGLTDSETRLTLELARGLQLRDAAEALNISINTARNHLQSVFSKSGIKRQSDLVLVVTQLSVILSATTDSAPPEKHVVTDQDYPRYRFSIMEDGSRLAFRRYGTGRQPVLYLHESVGSSRLLRHTAERATALDLSIYAPERPGTGFSQSPSEYSFASVARQNLHLLDELQIEQVTLTGFLSGAGHALYFAAAHPERVSAIFCLCGRPPTATLPVGFKPLNALRTKLINQPWVMNSIFNILRNRSSSSVNRRLIRNIYGADPNDAAFLDSSPETLDHMVAYTMESMAQGTAGIIDEMRCFTAAPQIDTSKLTMPITLWHGKHNLIAPPEDMQAFCADLDPQVRQFEDSGALMPLKHWDEVLEELARLSQEASP